MYNEGSSFQQVSGVRPCRKTMEALRQAARYHAERLREILNASMTVPVAIEPVSGEYFLGKTLSDAIGASRMKYPDRLAHAILVGHKAAIHFGMQIR